jgi:chromatin remodeling complex protein RSC6
LSHRELEVAKRKAAESFQELNNLRQSLDQSMRESTVLRNKNPHHRAPSTASIPEHDVLDVSMAEVTELVMQFQDSLQGLGSTAAGSTTGFVSGSRKSTAAPTSTASVLGFSRSTDSAQVDMDPAAASIDVNAFLERYSEKLADLVGEKLLSRMSVTK